MYSAPFEITTTILNLVAQITEKVGAMTMSMQQPKPTPKLRKENRIKTIQSSLAIGLLRLIRKNPQITIAAMCEAMKMSDKGVRKILDKLKQQGLLIRVGPNKGGHWELRET